jgi:tRNA(fMet)-specific endonuclease VapC
MLDANSVIYLLSGAYPRLEARVAACEVGEIGISTLVLAEILYGSTRGKPPLEGVLNQLIDQIPLLDFDAAAARAFAQLPFKWHSYDRLIAAQALSLGLTVITRNFSDFADVPGLKVEDWTI